MKLDLRNPTFVFLGVWNKAIFQPGWVLRHLFEVPEGQEVRGAQLLPADPAQAPILFIKNLGVAVASDRFSVYLGQMDDATVEAAERVAKRLFATLPHTPFGAYGVNFQFIEDAPEAALYDKLKTLDAIDQRAKLIRQNLIATIEIDAETLLNFSRQPSAQNVIFDLNYHHNKISVATCDAQLSGSIKKHYEDCKGLIRTLYNLEQTGTITIDIPELKVADNEKQTG